MMAFFLCDMVVGWIDIVEMVFCSGHSLRANWLHSIPRRYLCSSEFARNLIASTTSIAYYPTRYL